MPPRYDRPASTEHAPFYLTYVSKVPDSGLLPLLESQVGRYRAMLGSLPESRGDYAYAPGKWSIKQVVGHVIDAERVFSYRALVFARKDPASLPSFDENAWIQPAGFENRTVQDLLSEFASVRDSTLALFRHLPQEAVTRTGVASNNPVSVRALGYIIAGHALHHGGVLIERYGVSA
jgi:hypothetical protein